jgi:hypothetical protein
MPVVWGLLFLTGFYPLVEACRANRDTTLRQAVLWALVAWAAWVGAAWAGALGPGPDAGLVRYVALCLSGCAGVAVLGARRPGVGAWNFVVVGLLAVLLRPLAEGLGELRLGLPHLAFLAATLAVGLLNYLPTRLGPAAVLFGAGCGVEVARLAGVVPGESVELAGRCLLATAPWSGWLACRRPGPATEFDALWRAYRDRFGLVWGLRAREQFNRAAANAGWAVCLHWGGLRPARQGVPEDPGPALAALRAILKRFGPEEAAS